MTVHYNRFADNGTVGRKAGLPETVAEHRDRMAAGNAVVVRCKGAANGSSYAQHREIGTGNQFRLHSFRVIAIA